MNRAAGSWEADTLPRRVVWPASKHINKPRSRSYRCHTLGTARSRELIFYIQPIALDVMTTTGRQSVKTSRLSLDVSSLSGGHVFGSGSFISREFCISSRPMSQRKRHVTYGKTRL